MTKLKLEYMKFDLKDKSTDENFFASLEFGFFSSSDQVWF